MNAINKIKAAAAKKNTKTLIEGLFLLEAKKTLETHERMVRACLCDVIQDREGEEFIDSLLDQLEAA